MKRTSETSPRSCSGPSKFGAEVRLSAKPVAKTAEPKPATTTSASWLASRQVQQWCAIAATLLVCFLYGAAVWGVLPIMPRTSWETHLAAALIGLVLGLLLRQRDIPPRRQYSWEAERDDQVDEESIDTPFRE